MPLSTRLWIAVLTPPACMAFSVRAPSDSIPAASRSCKNGPIRKKVRKKTIPIMRMNIGMAVYLPVRMLSMRSLRLCSRLSRGLMTQDRQTFSI